jgi:hypothetical protein
MLGNDGEHIKQWHDYRTTPIDDVRPNDHLEIFKRCLPGREFNAASLTHGPYERPEQGESNWKRYHGQSKTPRPSEPMKWNTKRYAHDHTRGRTRQYAQQ